MLVLTRRVGESVMVGKSAKFTLLRVRGNRIRVGINAPQDVTIRRQEVDERNNRVAPMRDGLQSARDAKVTFACAGGLTPQSALRSRDVRINWTRAPA